MEQNQEPVYDPDLERAFGLIDEMYVQEPKRFAARRRRNIMIFVALVVTGAIAWFIPGYAWATAPALIAAGCLGLVEGLRSPPPTGVSTLSPREWMRRNAR